MGHFIATQLFDGRTKHLDGTKHILVFVSHFDAVSTRGLYSWIRWHFFFRAALIVDSS